ncbi:MAG: hypothetical protein ACLP0B_16985 [Steroidobacteraceae bacterium]
MKIPPSLADLHRAVSTLSQVEFQRVNSELTLERAINFDDAENVARALNTFKSFFDKIEKRRAH